MAVVDTLSTHSPDAEYIGERQQHSTWTGDADIIEVFCKFSAEIGRIEKEIDEINVDVKLKIGLVLVCYHMNYWHQVQALE
uniref:Lipoxygenase domain-containing protein n=1 Tax=Solanum lycopersicum TaxID=4081 RepID=A0A3Q7IFN4_SOLLC